MSKFKPLARQSEIVIQEFDNEILIYDLRADKAFNLNETSALIWQLSTGQRTVSQIAEDLSQKFNSEISEEFVWLALEKLQKENLVENTNEIAGFFEGVSRREIVRKVGLASVVVLPLVLALVAPTAIQAGGSTCNTVGNTACRCPCPATPIGGTCGQGTIGVPNGQCNISCTCTRTAAACPTTGPIAGTALGSCAP